MRASIGIAVIINVYFIISSTTLNGGKKVVLTNAGNAKEEQTNPLSVQYYPHNTLLPSWIDDYIEFHNAAVFLDEATNKTRLSDDTKFIVYSCHNARNCGGVGDRMNGIATVFYAAVLSRRVLIIDNPDPFPLKDVLLPNRIRWDVDEYPSTERKYLVINKVLNPIPFLREPCLYDTETHGIQIEVNQWYMPYLWASTCMQDLFLALNTTARNKDCSACNIFSEENKHHTYRWAFWTLFKFSNDVVDESIRLRVQAELDRTVHTHSTMELHTVDTASVAGLFRPYIAVHIRNDRHHGEETERMFLNCAHKFQKYVFPHHGRTQNIILISDKASMKAKFRSWDNATVKATMVEDFHVDEAKSRAKAQSARKAYLDVYAELIILIESECLVRSRSGYSELAQMVAISNDHTNERCGVQFDQCSDEAVNSATQSLYWNRNNASSPTNDSTWSSWVRLPHQICRISRSYC